MPLPSTPEDVAATFCATLVDEWIAHGVRHAVVAPGSRSTPLAVALASRAELALHMVHDERSASFVALGVGLTGVPAVLVCTSGTAAAHFHAAVIEAHQSAVPMLVCTADRPPELRDVGAPQTIDQTKLFGDAVRWFHDPGVAAAGASARWRGIAAQSFAAATSSWPGPVHLNLPFREPLLGSAGELPPRRSAGAVTVASTAQPGGDAVAEVATQLRTPRGLVVAGRGSGDPEAVRALCKSAGWPVLADARSGVRHLSDIAVSAADHILRSGEFAAAHRADVVVRLGEPPASKVVNQWLAASGGVQVHVSSVPAWSDPDGAIARRIVADPTSTCTALAGALAAPLLSEDEQWLAGWLQEEAMAQKALTEALAGGQLTEPAVARWLATMLPAGSHLVVASSMPIRDVEWFGLIPEGITVHSNRGANGIDGVLATAIGVAAATLAPTGVLIGDIAFVHDSSSLTALAQRGLDLRIVAVDNDGGGIFSFLPQAAALAGDRFEQLFGTPHGTDLVGLAAAHHLAASTVSDLDGLRAAVSPRGPLVVRVPSDRAANVDVHARLNALRGG